MQPPLPSEFEELIGSESDTICQLLVNNAKLIYLFYKLVRWMLNADLTATTEFKLFICQAGQDCPEEETTT